MSKKQATKNTTENERFFDFSDVDDLFSLVTSFGNTVVKPEEIAEITNQLLSCYGDDITLLFAGLQAMSNYFNAIRKEYHKAIEDFYCTSNN